MAKLKKKELQNISKSISKLRASIIAAENKYGKTNSTSTHTESESSHGDVVAFWVIIGMFIFIVGGVLFNIYVYIPNYAGDDFCESKGYKYMTDFEYSVANGYAIECDKVILPGYYESILTHLTQECVETNKWGECTNYDTHNWIPKYHFTDVNPNRFK